MYLWGKWSEQKRPQLLAGTTAAGSAVPGGAWLSQASAEQQKCNTHLIMGTSFQTFLSEQLKEKLMSLLGQSFATLLLASCRPEWWILSGYGVPCPRGGGFTAGLQHFTQRGVL